MIMAKVPVIPGSDGKSASEEAAERIISANIQSCLKLLLVVKVFNKVEEPEDLVAALRSPAGEAKAAFGNGAVVYGASYLSSAP